MALNSKQSMNWLLIVSVILILFGIFYAFFGLGVLPVIDSEVLLSWESALYGAVLMGWGTTLLFVGREAFEKQNKQLMKAIFYGIAIWLLVEALFSAYLGVWFNVGVDAAVFVLFSIPLLYEIRRETPVVDSS